MAAQLCRRCGGEFAAREDLCTFCGFPAAERSRFGRLFWTLSAVGGACLGAALVAGFIFLLERGGSAAGSELRPSRQPRVAPAAPPAPKTETLVATPTSMAKPATPVPAVKPTPNPTTPDAPATTGTETVGVTADLDLLDPAGTNGRKVEPVRRDGEFPR